ncbi:hypothetical protein Tsubulata_020736 [Turnera subulata]|uniref:Uncharacterized protein n=1 Tax=Turnera subulata TaxID=218843 RepID=A0A9Q0J6C2_9ROSI|nr:hypothetical protein Tsubulata_020736 [Turnera subulata]
MVQQTIDSFHPKFTEYGLGNSEPNFSASDKQFPPSVKKIALRDVQNENRIHNPVKSSTLPKNTGQFMDAGKVSSTQGASPESAVNPPIPFFRSAIGNPASAQRYYVRRKPEAQFGKTAPCEINSVSVDCLNSERGSHPDKTSQSTPQKGEPTVACFPAFAPLPVTSLTSASGKPSVSLPPTHSSMRPLANESNYHPVAFVAPSSNNSKGTKTPSWEERYFQLQVSLKRLDEADPEDYLQSTSLCFKLHALVLRSLSSVELSKHAVELEKRAIQLALEEAKEVQRVGVLNVLGKSMKNFKAPLINQSKSEKKES